VSALGVDPRRVDAAAQHPSTDRPSRPATNQGLDSTPISPRPAPDGVGRRAAASRSAVPATTSAPTAPAGADSEADAAHALEVVHASADREQRLAHSLIYAGVAALTIAAWGLFFVGARRRLW
jgi:hypothetical protein